MPDIPPRSLRPMRPLLSSHVLLPVLLLVLLGLVTAVHEVHVCTDHNHAHGSSEAAYAPQNSHQHEHPPASHSSPPEFASGLWIHKHLPTGEWAKAFGATGIISIFPTLVLPFIPLTHSVNGVTSLNKGVHKLLLSFAAGGLLGEVFLHSLPHLLEHHDHFSSSSSNSISNHDQYHQHAQNEEDAHDKHTHSHAHGNGVRLEEGEVMRICLWILAGFLLFFISEKVVTVVLGDEGGHSHSDSHRHSHTHSHAAHGKKSKSSAASSEEEEEEEGEEVEEEEGEEEYSIDSEGRRRRSPRIRERYLSPERRQIATVAAATAAGGRTNGGIYERKLSSSSSKKQQQRQVTVATGVEGGLKASGYLNIVVDVLHNVTDGIAIGASFSSGQGVGLATTLSVFLHEVPHEIGDFAILVQSGLSVRNAFLMQFFTAIAAFLGTFLGLVAKRQEGLERVLLALTTGGFLYVACVSVLPELLAGEGKGGGKGGQAVREVGGVVAGIGLMAWVAMGEHGHEH